MRRSSADWQLLWPICLKQVPDPHIMFSALGARIPGQYLGHKSHLLATAVAKSCAPDSIGFSMELSRDDSEIPNGNNFFEALLWKFLETSWLPCFGVDCCVQK